MKERKVILRILAVLALLSLLAFAPGQRARAGQPAGSSIIYNLFATDTYMMLADDTLLYNYGFVGGRQGQKLTYQTSFGADGSGGGNAVLQNGAPAPTGGPLVGDELALQGNASFPAPLIYATVGDVVEIRFKNLGTTNPTAPNDPHSIHLHGLDVNAANDGVPETSVGAVPANMCNDGTTAPEGQNCNSIGKTPEKGAGNVIVYMFSPKNPGTYMYHCHQEADIHVQMGMYGALVIYNRGDAAAATGPGYAKGGTLYGWKYDRDYVLMESDMDVRQHCSEEGTYTDTGTCPNVATLPGQTPDGGGYNPVDYQPQYWFLNGLSFPNTIHVAGGPVVDSWDNWIAAHPGYDPFIVGSVSTTHTPRGLIPNGDKVLIRMINMGFETQPMHMHGFHGKIIGSDERAWTWANLAQLTPWGMGQEKDTLTIGSGETYEWLIDMGQQAVTGNYPGGTQSKYTTADNKPALNTTSNLAIPLPGNTDDPPVTYIGGPTVTGAVIGNTPGQLFPFHNHDDYKATNNGAYPGGMFTMIMPIP